MANVLFCAEVLQFFGLIRYIYESLLYLLGLLCLAWSEPPSISQYLENSSGRQVTNCRHESHRAFIVEPTSSVHAKRRSSQAWWRDGARTDSEYACMDAKITTAETGHGVDDVVRRFHRLRQQKKPPGLAEWLRLISAFHNPSSALKDYNDMAAGKLIIPATNSLGPSFELFRRTWSSSILDSQKGLHEKQNFCWPRPRVSSIYGSIM